MKLKVVKLTKDALLPEYAHPGDAGLDLFAVENVKIPPGEIRMVKTGIAIELPPHTEGQVRPRSGLAAKYGLSVLNSPGTIDESYRGEVCVIMINHGKHSFTVEKGMRIAQLVISPVIKVKVQEAIELSKTLRGIKGFGSSGHKKLKREKSNR